MDEFIDSLGDAKHMATLDCNYGYWEIPLKIFYREKTTFKFHYRSYFFNWMRLGLSNAPERTGNVHGSL